MDAGKNLPLNFEIYNMPPLEMDAQGIGPPPSRCK